MYTIDEWNDGLNIPRSKTSVLSMLEDINVNQRQTGNKPVTVVCKYIMNVHTLHVMMILYCIEMEWVEVVH